MLPVWLEWAQKLQAIAQTGLTFAQSPFDVERYESIREIAAEIVASHSDADLSYVRELFAQERGYATPKIGVRGAVFRDDAILLVKERSDGRWTMPGGFIDVNESPTEAVVREIYEESGYHTRPIKLLSVYDPRKHSEPPRLFHIYTICFLCEIIGGGPSQSEETDGIGFFREDELPELSVHRTAIDQVPRIFEHYRNPNLPTDFD
jgi:ADP-ribose pyrophosphatase YjhB (NUDIX family)